ncbi:translation initiation factor 5 [Enteropsectra breve]|nr:translation initiation factor 5 [Enteropsectra breve]
MGSSMINIDRTKNDSFYRYKMPILAITHETKRTFLTNIEQIAKALYRDPAHVAKYIGMSVGCTQGCDNKRYFLNGIFESERLESVLYDFIDLFVLCKECSNPETKFVEQDVLSRSCNSCGAVVPQEPHRLNTTLARDLGKNKNEDKNYEKHSESTATKLMAQAGDNSAEIYECYLSENRNLDVFFKEYFKASAVAKFSKVLAELKIDTFLEHLEDMLERNGKEDKLELFLTNLMKIYNDIDAVADYFDSPRKNKKRSALIRKNFNSFMEGYDA